MGRKRSIKHPEVYIRYLAEHKKVCCVDMGCVLVSHFIDKGCDHIEAQYKSAEIITPLTRKLLKLLVEFDAHTGSNPGRYDG